MPLAGVLVTTLNRLERGGAGVSAAYDSTGFHEAVFFVAVHDTPVAVVAALCSENWAQVNLADLEPRTPGTLRHCEGGGADAAGNEVVVTLGGGSGKVCHVTSCAFPCLNDVVRVNARPHRGVNVQARGRRGRMRARPGGSEESAGGGDRGAGDRPPLWCQSARLERDGVVPGLNPFEEALNWYTVNHLWVTGSLDQAGPKVGCRFAARDLLLQRYAVDTAALCHRRRVRDQAGPVAHRANGCFVEFVKRGSGRQRALKGLTWIGAFAPPIPAGCVRGGGSHSDPIRSHTSSVRVRF
jgi:hypothetical protein